MSSLLSPRDLRGVFVPLVTPFTERGDVDEASFTKLVEALLDAEVDGFVLAGTTGESPTLAWPEVERLFVRLRDVVRGRVPLLVGTGTYDTRTSVAQTERARVLGADACLVVVPYYSRPQPAGVLAHFRAIAAVGLPVVGYHIPYRTGLTLDLPTLRALLALPGVVGVKESSGGIANIAALADGDRALICGEDALFLPALGVGAEGGILAAANLLPREYVAIHRAFRSDRLPEAEALWAGIAPTVEALFAESNPAPLKTALAHQGVIASPTLRLPLVPIAAALATRLRDLLDRR